MHKYLAKLHLLNSDVIAYCGHPFALAAQLVHAAGV
jgi:hypothetical protein